MKILKIFVFSLAILCGALLLVTAFLPSESKVSRSIVIYAPVPYSFQKVIDLKSWKDWFPIFKIDHNIYFTYNGKNLEYPDNLSWKSELSNVGDGHLKILSGTSKKQIKIIITLQNEKQGILNFIFHEKNNVTDINLEFSTRMSFFEKWMGFMLESIIGPTLEKSLVDIKSTSEYNFFKEKNQKSLPDIKNE